MQHLSTQYYGLYFMDIKHSQRLQLFCASVIQVEYIYQFYYISYCTKATFSCAWKNHLPFLKIFFWGSKNNICQTLKLFFSTCIWNLLALCLALTSPTYISSYHFHTLQYCKVTYCLLNIYTHFCVEILLIAFYIHLA